MKKERFVELNDLLMAKCHKYEKDCTACPYSKECEEYSKYSEYSEYNDICYHCKKWLNGCSGTKNAVYTGCVRREA